MQIASIRHKSPTVQVLDQLSQLIERGALKEGSLLPPERKLAGNLGVSRAVVREVAKKLEERGLVAIRQGIGVQVINNPSLPVRDALVRLLPEDRERLRQCAQARLLIEPELAAMAALRVTSTQARRLAVIHSSMHDNLAVEEAVEIDIDFHRAISELSGSRVLALLLQSVTSIGRISRKVTMKKFGIARARDFHSKIVATITAGNATAARNAMKRHLLAALHDLNGT